MADATERAAITHHTATIGDKEIAYTARAGHLVTFGMLHAKPAAKFFDVAFTADDADPTKRPFFYNGGPGSLSASLLLGYTQEGRRLSENLSRTYVGADRIATTGASAPPSGLTPKRRATRSSTRSTTRRFEVDPRSGTILGFGSKLEVRPLVVPFYHAAKRLRLLLRLWACGQRGCVVHMSIGLSPARLAPDGHRRAIGERLVRAALVVEGEAFADAGASPRGRRRSP